MWKLELGRDFQWRVRGGNLTGQVPKIRQRHRQAERVRYKDQDRGLTPGRGDSLGTQTKSRRLDLVLIVCAPRLHYAEAGDPRLPGVRQHWQGLHPALCGRHRIIAALALGAAVAASFRMSLNSNLRKAAAFLHPHRHGNRTKKAGKMAGVCADSRLLLVGETGSLFLRRWLQSQLSVCIPLPRLGKGFPFPCPWSSPCRHPVEGAQLCSLPASNVSHVGIDGTR